MHTQFEGRVAPVTGVAGDKSRILLYFSGSNPYLICLIPRYSTILSNPPPILRSAPSASPNLPGDPALFAPPKAVARALHFSHSPKSAALRWLGQEGLLGAERFASTDRRSLPRG
jgi:hypothetical protein